MVKIYNALFENSENLHIDYIKDIINSTNKTITLLNIVNFNKHYEYNHTFCLPHLHNEKNKLHNNNKIYEIDKYYLYEHVFDSSINKLKLIYSFNNMKIDIFELTNIIDNKFNILKKNK